jgi:hypothetical protein
MTSSSFSALASKSKIPPQLGLALGDVGKEVGDTVDAFGFHDEFLKGQRRIIEPGGLPRAGVTDAARRYSDGSFNS